MQKRFFVRSSDELIEAAFEWVWQQTILPIITRPPVPIDDTLAFRSGFLKYMIAQLCICDAFYFLPESETYRRRIVNYLEEHIATLTFADIEIVRGFYRQYLSLLLERGAITREDFEIYQEIYPLFPPFYIHYDRPEESYAELDAVSTEILMR